MIELPAELVTAISGLLVAVITKFVVDGFKALSESMGFDLGKLGTIVAAALSAFVVSVVIGLLNFGLGFIPPEYAGIVNAIFAWLLTVLAAMGIHRTAKLARPAALD